ncbi:L,D-transpeptidase [Mucilaginibacter terrenus]|uniref:L,D-transpeptidase n=1 Tax=Mucilaginibacter terrenus TaxID=2482727 RepID=A0A3E2NWC5_9SPHI|nr:L,D-transpeptidase family protein [Mucilaginibacter terrenus]RFZ85308.1 L,D-transpeptidase [Mucilaginibacter terrenus]
MMKKQMNIDNYHSINKQVDTLLLVCLFLVSLMLTLVVSTTARANGSDKIADKELSAEIAAQLSSGKLPLNFPQSAKRFYQQRQFAANWLVSEKDADQTWAAVLMLDCVLQFGLNQADYHPNELVASKLHDILERRADVPLVQKARYEIMLTDAVLSFVNNLHFGKYNPDYPASKVDKGVLPFDAISVLNKAVLSKDFMVTIVSAQPQNQLYQNLQERMHKVAGVQVGDCYEFPEAEVRKMALNMERLRWAALDSSNFIHVNVPSYKLSFYHQQAVDTFRVVVGKPGNPTPTLTSVVKYFTTAPEWKVPQKIFKNELLTKAIRDTAYLTNNHYAIYNNAGMLITPNRTYLLKIKQNPARYHATQSAGCDNALGQIVFRFPNIYEIYMHDTPQQELFKKDARAYSHGCIRVQQAAKLARLLLVNDGQQAMVNKMLTAINQGNRKNFKLIKPVPIAVTYLTCEVIDGEYIAYNDIYNLDNSLDMLMYKKDDKTLKLSQN